MASPVEMVTLATVLRSHAACDRAHSKTL